MNQLTHFNFETHDVTTELDDKGVPWFSANDICEILGFGNPRQALISHVDPEDVQNLDTLTQGGFQSLNFINESGMYALVFGSTKPAAKQFKRWVTSEVLPEIRKKGFYESPEYLKMKDAARKAKQLAKDNYELSDRNQYLEIKKAQFIDDHQLNAALDALKASEDANKELTAELHPDLWGATSEKLAKGYAKVAQKAGADIRRQVRGMRGAIKKTEWEHCRNLTYFFDQIDELAGFADHWVGPK